MIAMPIFEYECKKCGRLFEELVMSSCQEVACPACGSTKLDKLMSAPARKGGGCGDGASCGPT